MRNLNCFVLGLITLGFLAGCGSKGSVSEPLDSSSESSSAESTIIVVGRVDMMSSSDKEQAKGLEKKIILFTDDNYRLLKAEPDSGDYTGRIEATPGKNFFVRKSNAHLFILGGLLHLEGGVKSKERVYFPGGLKATIKSADKAVYIGTIQYHRNEFSDLSKFAVVDDYESVNAEFKKKFGTKYTLRKALLTPAN